MFIANQDTLESFIEGAYSKPVLAIDTEFLCERTYFPQLCLLQLATEDEVALIDPFSVGDLTPLRLLFEDERTIKLFHAGSHDIDILFREIGVMPHPIFDTQIAAALLGYTQQIGYASLVHAECGVVLNKIDSFTDWSLRPLSESQLQYAADDVMYLPRIYHQLQERLIDLGRLSWLEPDFADLIDPASYTTDDRDRYKHLKRSIHLTRRQLASAREVAAWRESEAKLRNIPRRWVLTDEQVVEACKRQPATIDELFMVRGIRNRLSTREARHIVKLIQLGLSLSEAELPEIETGGRGEKNVDAQLDLMLSLVRLRSKESGVAMPTLASHNDLVRLARGHRKDNPLLKGWRLRLVGQELLLLLEGKISLSLSGSCVRVDHTEKEHLR